jgi:hypothetical protein
MTTVGINTYAQILREISSLRGTGSLTSNSQRISTADSEVGKVTIKSIEPVGETSEYALFTFPYAPTDIKFEGLTDIYTELERPGLQPLVRRQAKKTLKVSFTARIVDRDSPGTGEVETMLSLLSSIGALNVDVVLIGLGAMTSGLKFRITDMSSDTIRMNPQQRITIADVNITFTEVVTVRQPVPGMILLKDPPISNYVAPSANHKSGTKTTTKTSSQAEVDKWTLAKMSVLGI